MDDWSSRDGISHNIINYSAHYYRAIWPHTHNYITQQQSTLIIISTVPLHIRKIWSEIWPIFAEIRSLFIIQKIRRYVECKLRWLEICERTSRWLYPVIVVVLASHISRNIENRFTSSLVLQQSLKNIIFMTRLVEDKEYTRRIYKNYYSKLFERWKR